MSASCVVLVSGGIDSTVLLHEVARQRGGSRVYALGFDYGQRHGRELACARWQAESVGAIFRLVRLDFFADLARNATALLDGGLPVPDLDALSEAERSQPPTYVPNRNMILLSIAAAAAEAMGIRDVYYGAQAQDEYGYWDCTPTFLERVNAVLSLNRRQPVTIHAPLVRHSKADNVRLGVALGVNFARTWSCYRGEEAACGTCPTCVERLKAFAACGVRDPIPYAREVVITGTRENE
ncbi:MAG TPA: 7-cyano-7-deazaguanine synthase QueC [Candidatus Hydrogenedentes bacterium]|nr:7-cyano-7-deazaguanine synthase QueC [Candidatus Hydrogenedentota bacterium]HPO30405.1 7-cyano-7-deazaguanine synthase QueC [Candidatus Hydrogenedentota bacterium]